MLRLSRETDVEIWSERSLPISLEIRSNWSTSLTPPAYRAVLDADHSLFMPVSPHTSIPCDQDWRMVCKQMPFEPKCE